VFYVGSYGLYPKPSDGRLSCHFAMMPHHGLLYRTVDSDENIQPQMLKETIPFIILATFAVVGRYFSRRVRQASFGADDYMVLLALVSSSVCFRIES